MDSTSYEYFLAVSDLHSFTKAAEKLHISQPALSHRIISLEEELGARLLNRSNMGVSLTPAGEYFYNAAKKYVDSEKVVKKKLKQYQSGIAARLIIGYSELNYLAPLLSASRAMKHEHPSIDLEYSNYPREEIIYGLLRREIDVAYVVRGQSIPIQDTVTKTIRENSLVALVYRGHPLWNHPVVTVNDLRNETIIYSVSNNQNRPSYIAEYTLNEYKKLGLHCVLCESPNTRLFQVALGNYISIGGALACENLEFFSPGNIRQIPIVDFHSDIGDLCSVYYQDNQYAEIFTDYMANAIE